MGTLMFMLPSFIFGVALCLLHKVEGSPWEGMNFHFINNASVNLLYAVPHSGTDTAISEEAGTAAAIAAKQGIGVAAIGAAQLQNLLKDHGAFPDSYE
jgi:uncharacterized membrane protein